MTRLLIATANRGKIFELQAMLDGSAQVVSLEDLDIASPAETGATFAENAVLKAEHGAAASGLVTVADDSGIEVDALGGEPGVRSARYAGEPGDDARNREKLLHELGATPARERAARFVSVIAVAVPGRAVQIFRGTLDGTVAPAPRGTGGFGYDSLLEMPDGRTVAEMTAEEKNVISHRGQALRLALPYIEQVLSSRRDGPEDSM